MNLKLRILTIVVLNVSILQVHFSNASDIASSGSTSTFTYEREAPDSKFLLVVPTDDTGAEPTAVSESFLQVVLRNAPDDATRLKVITQYPQIMEGIYNEKMEGNYPDSSVEFDSSFQTYQGDNITIVQDPLAPPYVQISLKLPSGEVETFSLNRDIVESVLIDSNIDKDSLLAALQSFPYRLPERARPGFEYLTASNIFEMAEQDVEGVKRQEFVKTRQWYKRRREMQANAALNIPTDYHNPVVTKDRIADPIDGSVAKPSKLASKKISIPSAKINVHKAADSDELYERDIFSRAFIILLFASALIAVICILIFFRRK